MKPARIMIVEDDAITARSIEGMLKRSGYVVPAIASSGKEAIQKVDKTDPDLVLMDIRLRGEIDGIEAAEEIRTRFGIPVVFLTAYADDETLERAKTTEPYGYVVKPFRQTELNAAIQIALSKNKMGQKVKESEKKYRRLFENMREGFAHCKMLLDENNQPVDFAYLDVNDSFQKLTGLKKETVIGKKVTEVIPGIKDLHPELFDIYGRVALTGKEAKFEIYFEPLEIWLSISAYSPQKGYFVAVFDNITQRKRAEEALRTSEERFRSSVETLLDGFAIFSAIRDDSGHIVDFRYEYINEVGCQLNRRTYGEQVGHTLLELLPAYRGTGLLDKYAQLVETGQPLEMESLSYEDSFGGDQRLARVFDARAAKLADGFSVAWRDVTERRKAEEEIREQRTNLRTLSKKLMHVQEEERKRISRELHDEMGQSLTGMRINLTEVKKILSEKRDQEIKERLADTITIVDQTLGQMRNLAFELRPTMLDDLGLVPTLRSYLKGYATRLHIEVDFEVTGVEERLPAEVETAFFRVTQEALTNVARHAEASKVRVRLRSEDSVAVLSIEDDGVGFHKEEVSEQEAPHPGTGLIGMKERAIDLGGSLTIQSRLGKGTQLFLEVPRDDEDNR